jgi:thiol-disulfide isomerase/thioredoxin
MGVAMIASNRALTLNKHTYVPFIAETRKQIAVINFYDKECLPCKKVMRMFDRWVDNYDRVLFAKVEYNRENRELFQQIGIASWPTLHVILDTDIIYETKTIYDVGQIDGILKNWQ